MIFDSTINKEIYKSFLEWIHNQDNHVRIERYEDHDEYYHGEVDVKIPSNIKAVLAKEFGFTGNVCRAVVDAAVRFLSKESLSIELKVPRGIDEEEREDDRGEAEAYIYELFRQSKLLMKNYIKALRIQGKKGEFALKAVRVLDDNEEEVAGYKINVLKPDICFPKWKDENYEEMEYFSVQYLRDNPDTGEKEQYAQVIWPDQIAEFVKPIDADDGVQWTKIDEWENEYGFIPVEWVRNKEDDTPWSESDITDDLKDIQDGFNKAITDLLYSMDSESFRQVFVMGSGPPKDEKGNPKDVESAPGKIHWINGKGEKVPSLAEIEPSNFEGLLSSIDKLLEIVSVITHTPKNELSRGGSGSVPTGVALRTIYQPFIGKTNEKWALFKSGAEGIITKIFQMAETDNVDVSFNNYDYIPEVHNESGLPKDEEERAKVHEFELNNKIKSRRTIQQERGVEDVEKENDQIKEEEEEMMSRADPYGERVNRELGTGEGEVDL
ncbi:MAG: phage portal protein [bacterium]